MKKRMNLYMTSDMYAALSRITDDYGFRSRNQLVTTLLGAFVRTVLRAERREAPEDSDEAYIAAMFDGFAEWEPQPEAGHAPVIHGRGRKRNHGKG